MSESESTSTSASESESAAAVVSPTTGGGTSASEGGAAGTTTIADIATPTFARQELDTSSAEQNGPVTTFAAEDQVPLGVIDDEVSYSPIEDVQSVSIDDDNTARGIAGEQRKWWHWILIIIAALTAGSARDKRRHQEERITDKEDK